MSVLFIALPIALVLGAAAVLAFVRSVHSGQFDDLVTPAVRVVFDDADARLPGERGDPSERKSRATQSAGGTKGRPHGTRRVDVD
jgi:cbb3-type cytochrome oxidase maturation protein